MAEKIRRFFFVSVVIFRLPCGNNKKVIVFELCGKHQDIYTHTYLSQAAT